MSPRPGRVAGIVEIDLAQPRRFETREEPRFFEKLVEVREMLRGAGA
jgi:NitT/TauT family transport system ATP-binding protein